MEKPEVVQTKSQRSLAIIAKISFFIWAGTIWIFIISLFYANKFTGVSWFGTGFLLNIALGVIAFLVALIGHGISRPRKIEETRSIIKTFWITVGGIALLIVLAMLPRGSTPGSIEGAKTFNTPAPIFNNLATPQPTPTPKANVVKATPKTPQITCIGPDSKEFQTSESECIKFRQSWGLSASPVVYRTPTPNQNSTNNSEPYATLPTYPPCTIYYTNLHTSSTYTYMTPEQCTAAQKQSDSYTIYSPSPTPIPTPQPTANNQDMCNSLIAEWSNNKQAFYANNYNNYSSSAEAIIALINMMQPYQNALNNLGCIKTLSPY